MTDLTEQSLEEVIVEIERLARDQGEVMAIRPTYATYTRVTYPTEQIHGSKRWADTFRARRMMRRALRNSMRRI